MAQQPPDEPRPPRAPARRSVGRYELLLKLASGGMGSVYLGRARGMGGFERLVAVKLCHEHLADDGEFARMFLDEARLAARIHHPNVVSTVDVGSDGALYLVMDYVDGQRLGDLLVGLVAEGSTPVPLVLRVMIDTLEGLHAAHELRGTDGAPLHLVHRDVSPQNVLVGLDGVARLTDFGVAKAATNEVITRTGFTKGKLAYMAPEQYLGEALDQRADVFAAGIVCWEALTGRRMFFGANDLELARQLLNAPIDSPAVYRDDLPPGLVAAVCKALERKPEGRFASAAEFARALEHCGAPVASTRAVAEAVERVLGPSLRKRSEALREALRSAAETAPAFEAPAREGPVTPPTMPAGEAPRTTRITESSARPPRPTYVARGALALAGLLALGGLAFGARALRAPTSAGPTATATATAATTPHDVLPVTITRTETSASAAPVAVPIVPNADPALVPVVPSAPAARPARARRGTRPTRREFMPSGV